jgi:hypothetical protein
MLKEELSVSSLLWPVFSDLHMKRSNYGNCLYMRVCVVFFCKLRRINKCTGFKNHFKSNILKCFYELTCPRQFSA